MEKILSSILKAPLVILVIAVFVASVYVAYDDYLISSTTPIIFGTILLLYFVGVFLGRNKFKEAKMEETEKSTEEENTKEETKSEESKEVEENIEEE